MSYRKTIVGSILIGLFVATACSGEKQLISTLDNVDATNDTSTPDTRVDTGGPFDAAQDANDTGSGVENGPYGVDFCLQAARALCDRLYDCGGSADLVRTNFEEEFGFENKFDCRLTLSRNMGEYCQPAAIGAQKGRATYKPAAADACLGQLETASCDVVTEGLPRLTTKNMFEPSFCDDIVVAKQQGGESCLAHSDCAGQDAYCSGSTYVNGSAVNGTCSTRGQVGMSCTTPQDCADGLDCDIDGICSELPGEDESCDFVCQSGLVCNRLLNQCKPLGAVSDPCDRDSDCQTDLACADDDTCQAAPANGESCSGRCAQGLKCDFSDRTCKPLPAQGESCSTDCAAGLTCADDFTCQPIANEGDSCAAADCVDGLFCDAATTCSAPALVGESCQIGDCIWYATCPSGTCEVAPTLGEPCTEACLEPSLCSGGTCVDPSSLEPCNNGSCSATDEFCDNGLCVKG